MINLNYQSSMELGWLNPVPDDVFLALVREGGAQAH